MANRKSAKAVARATTRTEARGRASAVKMLGKMEDDYGEVWPWSLTAMYRPVGTQQDNVVLRHLEAIQHDRELLAGFCAVLTDYLGMISGGEIIPNIDHYAGFTDRDITGTPGPWPRMDDGHKAKDAEFERFMQVATAGPISPDARGAEA